MVKQIVVRLNYNTLKRLMKSFPSYKGETMPNYFNRLARALESKERLSFVYDTKKGEIKKNE